MTFRGCDLNRCSSQYDNESFTEMCSVPEAGSYLMLIYFFVSLNSRLESNKEEEEEEEVFCLFFFFFVALKPSASSSFSLLHSSLVLSDTKVQVATWVSFQSPPPRGNGAAARCIGYAGLPRSQATPPPP